jgi:hypothetical protein
MTTNITMNMTRLFESILRESKSSFYKELLARGFTPKEAKVIILKGKTSIDQVGKDDLFDDCAISFDEASKA